MLAHPIRSRILTALRQHGPSTATSLALRLGTNSGTTSYHLRKLANVGLVTEAHEHGDGRDRWWRAAQDSHSFSAQQFADDPDAQAAADWLSTHYLRFAGRMAKEWLARRHEWSLEWQQAAAMSDYRVHLTPDRLEEMNAEIEAILDRYHAESDPDQPDARNVIVILQDFPVE
jgi:predicted ArsR family transcriptional regulator